jgi:hypothetical protein
MPVMAPQTINEKYAALVDLYGRIEVIAKKMGGAAVPVVVSVSHMIAIVPDPRSEDVPALRVKMPDGFRVEFAPSTALGSTGVRVGTLSRITSTLYTQLHRTSRY